MSRLIKETYVIILHKNSKAIQFGVKNVIDVALKYDFPDMFYEEQFILRYYVG